MAMIKAGTYRFQDALVLAEVPRENEISCSISFVLNTVAAEFGVPLTANCSKIFVHSQCMSYYVESTVPDMTAAGAALPWSYPIYAVEGYRDFGIDGWNTVDFDEGIRTIVVTEDAEASDAFCEWFTANAVEVVEGKQISGVWKFNDRLAHTSGIDEDVHFTAKYSFEYEGTHSGTISCNGLSFIEGDGFAFRLRSMFHSLSNPTDQMIAESVLGVPFPFEAAIYKEYMNGIDYGFAFISEGFDFQTIDFGTEPQYVSDEFYTWLTENATQPSASIQYNGSAIASLFDAGTATLKCAGMKMESDVVVEVAESANKECEHEVYDLSTGTRFNAHLKPKIDKPTEAQIAEFANGVGIVFQPHDTELLRSIVEVDYGLRISADTTLPCIYFRDTAMGVTWYYIWEDDVATVKAMLEQMGLDASSLTTEGWYSVATAVVKVTEEELLEREFESLIDFYVRPYGDYFYSLFDFYREGNNETADQILVERNRNDYPFVMAAQEKLCKKDIINIIKDNAFETVVDKNGKTVEGYESIKEYRLFGTIKVDLITTLDISGMYCRYTQYAYDHIGNKHQITQACSIGKRMHFNKYYTYGFAINVDGISAAYSNPKITAVYTNATVVSQSEREVYISGMPHDVYIVLVVEAAE